MISGQSTRAPREYADYVLIRDLYRCTPTELDAQPLAAVELHREFLAMERREEFLREKRSEQRADLRRTLADD